MSFLGLTSFFEGRIVKLELKNQAAFAGRFFIGIEIIRKTYEK
jgi:hypothetical protein